MKFTALWHTKGLRSFLRGGAGSGTDTGNRGGRGRTGRGLCAMLGKCLPLRILSLAALSGVRTEVVSPSDIHQVKSLPLLSFPRLLEDDQVPQQGDRSRRQDPAQPRGSRSQAAVEALEGCPGQPCRGGFALSGFTLA